MRRRTGQVNHSTLLLTVAVAVSLGAAAQFTSMDVVICSRAGDTTIKMSDRQMVARMLGTISRAAKQIHNQQAAEIHVRLVIRQSTTPAVGCELAGDWMNQPIGRTLENHLLNLPPPVC